MENLHVSPILNVVLWCEFGHYSIHFTRTINLWVPFLSNFQIGCLELHLINYGGSWYLAQGTYFMFQLFCRILFRGDQLAFLWTGIESTFHCKSYCRIVHFSMHDNNGSHYAYPTLTSRILIPNFLPQSMLSVVMLTKLVMRIVSIVSLNLAVDASQHWHVNWHYFRFVGGLCECFFWGGWGVMTCILAPPSWIIFWSHFCRLQWFLFQVESKVSISGIWGGSFSRCSSSWLRCRGNSLHITVLITSPRDCLELNSTEDNPF